jgi:FlaA1/EpsC-like NDP-sugar epimerase
MISSLILLRRPYKQAMMILFDFMVIISSIFSAFFLRLGYFYFPVDYERMQVMLFAAPFLAIPIFYYFGLYRAVTRYVNLNSVWSIVKATSMYALIWGLIAFMIANWQVFPRSVILINWLIVLLTITGSRILSRWIFLQFNDKNTVHKSKKILIYGAGAAGRQLSSALTESSEFKPVAFIDDDPEMYHHSVNGLEVYSKEDIPKLIKQKNISEILLAIPSISRLQRNEVMTYLEPLSLMVRSLPSVIELAQGKVKVDSLLEIDVKDLLGRESIIPKDNSISKNIKNKVVLVTGAGGSIGSELSRQILLQKPKKLVLYEISEASLYLIEQELNSLNSSDVDIFPVIGSVTNKQRLITICKSYEVNTIYHAAAYKHVPLIEYNQSQGVLNNTIGTWAAAEAAISANVETFVLISTDKAVRPTSVMGASKRVSELILQAFSEKKTNTLFTMVRFGNVLDSSGSVIPLFRKQIKMGGPITVTHTDVVRYFMTIPEAVELVIQAGAMAIGGEVFFLDMGKPVRIYDLAFKMIQLSGLQVKDEYNPKGDIEIKYTGLRPGEKLFEELLVTNKFSYTENKLIMRAEEKMMSWANLKPLLIEIEKAANNTETEKIYKLFKILVPEFNITKKDFEDLEWKSTQQV